jgi:very-short-patch-repair endonuclease
VRVAVEADGRRWHATSADFQRDLRRSRGLAALRWHHLRYGWADVHERPAEVVAELRHVFAAAAA